MSASKENLEPLPALQSDTEAERFVDEADLTAYDLSVLQETRFSFSGEAEAVQMHLPRQLLEALEARAKTRGISVEAYVRETLENAVARSET